MGTRTGTRKRLRRHVCVRTHAGSHPAALGVRPWIVGVYGYQGCAVTGGPHGQVCTSPGTGARGEELGDSGLA